MTRQPYTKAEIEEAIQNSHAGMRWCTTCGWCLIPKSEPSYVTQCAPCREKTKDAEYCNRCGEHQDNYRLSYARRHGFMIRYCKFCRSQGPGEIYGEGRGMQMWCKEHACFHPSYFHAALQAADSPPPDATASDGI